MGVSDSVATRCCSVAMLLLRVAMYIFGECVQFSGCCHDRSNRTPGNRPFVAIVATCCCYCCYVATACQSRHLAVLLALINLVMSLIINNFDDITYLKTAVYMPLYWPFVAMLLRCYTI